MPVQLGRQFPPRDSVKALNLSNAKNEEVFFTETTTLGVRRQEWDRTALERDRVVIETPYGPVAIKVGRRGGRVYNAQPEFEDCRRAAEERGVPVKEVWAAALAAYRERGRAGR